MYNDGRVVNALIDLEIDDQGNYKGTSYELVMQLLKSLTTDELSFLHTKLDDLKLDIERLILKRN